MRRYTEKFIGYAIVIGSITFFTALAVYYENSGSRQISYADYLKDDVLYKVIGVYDGDTIVISAKGHEVPLRLIGIDTPEVVDKRKPIQCYGPEASDKAKEILLGREVYIEIENDRVIYDIYNRVLAYVYLSPGYTYNEYMIREGYAREYSFKKESYKYQKIFLKAQEEAQRTRSGLWGKC